MSANHFNIATGPLGNQQISANSLPDTVARVQPGFISDGISPYWGGGRFVYGRFGGTVRQYGLCTKLPVIASGAIRHDFTEVANTANLGASLFVAMTSGTVGQFGWFMFSGVVPVNCNAAVAVDTTFGIAAAGQGGANAAGKQILNGRVVIASTTAVVKANCSGVSGAFTVIVPNADGLFMGCYMSGTGIGAAATITAIDDSGTLITLSVANSAAVSGSVTGTYNNATIFYNVAMLNSPFAQGAIT